MLAMNETIAIPRNHSLPIGDAFRNGFPSLQQSDVATFGTDDAARPACGYARQRFLHTPGDLAVRIDAVPIALECLPHADILHAELVLQQTHGVRKSFGEAAWIRTERAQRAILPIDIGPSMSSSTQDTGMFLRRNSSILAMIARSLTSCPSESHVHHPSPASSFGNAR